MAELELELSRLCIFDGVSGDWTNHGGGLSNVFMSLYGKYPWFQPFNLDILQLAI